MSHLIDRTVLYSLDVGYDIIVCLSHLIDRTVLYSLYVERAEEDIHMQQVLRDGRLAITGRRGRGAGSIHDSSHIVGS